MGTDKLRRLITGIGVCVAAVLVTSVAAAQVEMTVRPTLAPNLLYSPNKEAYAANLHKALQSAEAQAGDENTPAASVSLRDRFKAVEVVCASFPLWQGTAHPPAPLNAEFGNRIQFALRVVGNGTKFRLSDLSFRMECDDSRLGEVHKGNLKEYRYDWSRVGIDYGPDRKRGTADDKVYNAGEDSTVLVDELLYCGAGMGWQPEERPEATKEARQAAVDTTAINLTAYRDLKLTCHYVLASPDDPEAVLARADSTVTILGFPEQEEPLEAGASMRPLMIGAVVAVGLVTLVIVGGVLKERFFPSKGV